MENAQISNATLKATSQAASTGVLCGKLFFAKQASFPADSIASRTIIVHINAFISYPFVFRWRPAEGRSHWKRSRADVCTV